MTEPIVEHAAADTQARRRPLFGLVAVGVVAAVVAVIAAIQLLGDDDTVTAPPMEQAPPLSDLAPTPSVEGEVAPEFSVPTLDGAGFSLADHLASDGRPVLLNLWASWCLPCRAEMPELDEAAARHPGVLFVGVAVQDDSVAAEEFAREIGVDYVIGFDERDEVDAAYPSLGLPATFLISGEGRILERIFGQVTGEQIDGLVSTYFGG